MKILLSFCLAFLGMVNINAQSPAWDTYGIGFKVQNDFTVRENTDSKFYAISSDGLIDVTVLPWSDASITKDHLEEALITLVTEEPNINAELDADELQLNDFDGYYLVAAYDGDMILVGFLLDTQSATNVIVEIGFVEGNEDEAVVILTSYYAYDCRCLNIKYLNRKIHQIDGLFC